VKLKAIHTVPVWECAHCGGRHIGFNVDYSDDGRLVGWANVLVIEIRGEKRMLLAGPEAGR
jgi:hypothetical protein